MQDTRVTVQVAGQKIRLRGTDDETYIKSIAAYVEEKVDELQNKYPSLSISHCLVMGALNIADELFQLRQQYADLDHRIEELRNLTTTNNQPRQTEKRPIKRPFEQKETVKS